ncbi:MAG: carboxy-S-adenosyl-L-methionine synthase CmoA [Pseudomonadota bacterium]
MTDPRSGRDTLFADPKASGTPFTFDGRVADVFPDMISRSVPGYGLVIDQIGTLTQRFARAGTCLYDLGCSLGAATLALRHNVRVPGCRIVAIDNSSAMVARCRRIMDRDPAATPVEVREADVTTVEFEPASLVVMNYTLQFIDPDDRSPLLARIAAALEPGGALVLSEKIEDEDPGRDALLGELHHDFKRAQGYSELEISGKRASLENVLVRESWGAHRERLLGVGFRSAAIWFRCYTFASMIALK